MLQRMRVDSNNSDGSSPLMVLLVEMLVKAGVVEEPARKDEDGLKTVTLWRMLVVQLVCHPFCKCFIMSKL